MGALGATLALFGPFGAAAGAILGILSSILSAVLEALKPASESMISQIEKLLDVQTLKETHAKITAGLAVWRIAESYIDGVARLEVEFDKDDIDHKVRWQHHYQLIIGAFADLQANAHVQSEQWMHLFDLNIIYAMRFWIYLERVGVLLAVYDAPAPELGRMSQIVRPELAISRAKLRLQYQSVREEATSSMRKSLDGLQYAFRNQVDFYSLYLNESYSPFHYGSGRFGHGQNSIYYRLGAVNSPAAPTDIGVMKSRHFATSDSGTIFLVGKDNKLWYGRRGNEWLDVPMHFFHNAALEQVAIGQVAQDDTGKPSIIVVCLHAHGGHLSFGQFNDETLVDDGGVYRRWKPGAWRWRPVWGHYSLPDGYCILSMAVRVNHPHWELYAFALDKIGDGRLYRVTMGANSNIAGMEEVAPEAHFGKAWLNEVTYGVAPEHGRQELSPCTISCVGDDLYLQVGNRICERVNGRWNAWNVQDVLKGPKATYQARFYADGTQVFATEQGLTLRYRGGQTEDSGYTTIVDPAIRTICFSKGVSSQAVTAFELLNQLGTKGTAL